ncbi:MAG: endonuclease Q family protein, partial [Candidatus Binatia bacterium]
PFNHSMRIVADLHIHSRYSRACSQEMEVTTLARWARIKGVNLLGTGDFTHPLYFAELKAKLETTDGGLLRLKGDREGPYFIPTVEVNNIYHQGGRLRKIHTLIVAPNLEVVEKINYRLRSWGNLSADGRPTFTTPAKDLVKLVLDLSPDSLLIPAHAWTPWFSVFGSNSGFDSLEECFQEEAKNIYAIETGLSSDPAMNWRLSALDRITLISNSDAHSPRKIAREANVLDCAPTYQDIAQVLKSHDPKRFLFTIEFFPEEGKYHYDGHRNCGVTWSPAETKRHKALCPVCGAKVTVGVMHRVDALADREEGTIPPQAVPAKHLVPLEEILAQALEAKPGTKTVDREYERLTGLFGSELQILLDIEEEELKKNSPPRVWEGILKIRRGEVKVEPGYDEIYGKISLPPSEELPPQAAASQLELL